MNDELLRQIEEDMFYEKLQNLWRQFGKYAVNVSLLIVLATVGFVAWQNYMHGVRQEMTGRLMEAVRLYRGGDYAKAAGAFATLKEETSGGLRTAAALYEAEARAKTGGAGREVQTLYETLGKDEKADPSLRQLGALLGAYMNMQEAGEEKTGKDDAILAALTPLTEKDGVFAATARELAMAQALKMGEYKKALDLVALLGTDPSTPHTLRQRALALHNLIVAQQKTAQP